MDFFLAVQTCYMYRNQIPVGYLHKSDCGCQSEHSIRAAVGSGVGPELSEPQ